MRFRRAGLIVGLTLLFTLLGLGSANAESVVIALESAGLRAKPDFFAAIQSTIPYGTQVDILAKEGAWMKVKNGTVTGWMHKSSFAKAGPILKDIGKGEKATKETYKDEIVTAGKGFSESSKTKTDSSGKNDDSTKRSSASEENIKFEAVDEIEARQVPEPKIQEFMEKGGLESKVLGK